MPRSGGRPTKIRIDRDHQHQHRRRGRHHGAGKSEAADRRHQQRHADDPAETRAVQREADRHAALLIEPEAERIGDDAEAGAGPAERQQRVDGIELPRRGHLADQDGRSRHRDHAAEQAVARTERPHRLADKGDQHRAEQIEEGRRRRDQRGRPALQPMQFGQIDALAIEAEPPAEGRDQKADRDDAPALVTDRGLVDDDRTGAGGVHASLAGKSGIAGLTAAATTMLRSSAEMSRCSDREIRTTPAISPGALPMRPGSAPPAPAAPAETPPG